MKRDLLWIGLFILALRLLESILKPISFLWAMLRSKDRIDFIKECANSIDQTINAFGRTMFNNLWVRHNEYRQSSKNENLSNYILLKSLPSNFMSLSKMMTS